MPQTPTRTVWRVRVKDAKTGEYHTLTGNMSGCLLADYEIGQKKALKGLPEDGALITTNRFHQHGREPSPDITA